MSVIQLSKEQFDFLNIDRQGPALEKAWFRSGEIDVAGTIVLDPTDMDWGYVLLGKESDGLYRFLDGKFSLATRAKAEVDLFEEISRIEKSGSFEEEIYKEEAVEDEAPNLFISTIDDEIKRYLKKYPDKLYDLPPRKFEELIASIIKDMGFDVQLTQATRDGGRDIIAYVRTAVSSYLTHIECKRFSPDNKVGVGIIRQVLGVHQLRNATKSIIVTTSFFSRDAVKEAEIVKNQLDLKDFDDIKSWLQEY